MESENLSKKNNPSEVGFYTQINNPVDMMNLEFGTKKVDRHSKNMSEFDLPEAFPNSNYYQLSRPKKSFGPMNTSKLKPHINKNFSSIKKKGMVGTKSTHSSMVKRNRQKNQLSKVSKKGNSVISHKSQNKFTFSGSVNRNYKKKQTPWRKEQQDRMRKKRNVKKTKQEKRKRRGTLGVQSVKVDTKLTHSVYSGDKYPNNTDIRSMKKIDSSNHHLRKKAKAREKQIMGDIYSKKRESSYLTSSEISDMFEQSVDVNKMPLIQKWGSQGLSDRPNENFSGNNTNQDYGSEKMDFFQAKLNEIQSKYISSENYKLK